MIVVWVEQWGAVLSHNELWTKKVEKANLVQDFQTTFFTSETLFNI
jgi:hypothetical protein